MGVFTLILRIVSWLITALTTVDAVISVYDKCKETWTKIRTHITRKENADTKVDSSGSGSSGSDSANQI